MNAFEQILIGMERGPAPEPDLAKPAGAIQEDDLAFYRRRALEEATAAQRARCPKVSAAHRYLAAAYAEQV